MQSVKKQKLHLKCFEAHEAHRVPCQKKSCGHWLDFKGACNCVIVAAKHGPYTLQEIGKIYGLTRMRICQIEKMILKKIKDLPNFS